MDAAGHLAAADRLVEQAEHQTDPGDLVRGRYLIALAQAHAAIALAAEAGVPHSTSSTGAGSGG